VFNRVLRHNVRNDMNVVFGRARQIQEVADGTVAEHGEQIAAVAADLVTVGRKARSAATVFGGETTTRRVALDDLVSEVATAVGEEYPDASIDTTGVGGRLRTNPETLRLVVRETIENAAAHAGVSPSVEIWTERADGETQITVADDGPGVPPDELEPVRSGTETDLTHASSLGLWLIHWGVQSLGGAFDVENDDGAVVTLSLPAADDDA
jgi:signal transduction histidine kinase